ncbi:MAG: cytochrome ubiquinol oxidase subunit I [Desulfobacula sp.]|jgi:cytochrome bd ubiquinol oxidase subunit I|uniref:cytochrome ubiquinol oxidase subunit I n=1 Tax=Desulfobacula sp. TaxID=2593537 RepID=UPI001D4C0E35|nr:cytochrome ubiquinol oxidase subunit I [Desulfobacula sp.]MBT3484744.1 cytochrome ubiquinol oxidase subunit I [Desulfobacula sp.]MBT3804374.1 cytochrome ubiquinol oxidase subunit I [Desulfobacula sp.]MBT4025165.1 cytochrome ubiquinol oxidase subunit I [Desulfobacula sp.]MBT4198567.1 cytochrome ubiquinol oxidase subunit I [Desulfobacula sp.]
MVDIDLSMVNWARAQFALTAMYHWIFVPLTLGLSFLCAFFESIYVRTGDKQWRAITKFWMTLFGINFAIGVATGIILEFEFGTNWSNYSWIVGDIFGAPLAIEGIFAFFLEATFFAVMFFGWHRVSKGFHLFSTWMVAIGSNLSAVWILVANGWMQNPVGMIFNPETARFEMNSFSEVVFNPVAVSKFVHTSSSGFLFASLFVLTISCWYLIKGRHIQMAKKSIVVASVFGLLSSSFVAFTGDESAYEVAQKQPMKLAAIEGLYKGQTKAPIEAGILNHDKKPGDDQDPFIVKVKIPFLLSLLANRSLNSFVPGIDDLVYGNKEQNIEGVASKINKGKAAINDLALFKQARKEKNSQKADLALADFRKNQEYMGYGYLNTPEEAVPPVAIPYYAFHIMVTLGSFFPVLFAVFLFYAVKGSLTQQKWLLPIGLISGLLGLIAQQSGWVVAEVGRQPWAINGLLPVKMATTNLSAVNVQITFFMFLGLFTILLAAEITIMLKQISIGPEGGSLK